MLKRDVIFWPIWQVARKHKEADNESQYYLVKSHYCQVFLFAVYITYYSFASSAILFLKVIALSSYYVLKNNCFLCFKIIYLPFPLHLLTWGSLWLIFHTFPQGLGRCRIHDYSFSWICSWPFSQRRDFGIYGSKFTFIFLVIKYFYDIGAILLLQICGQCLAHKVNIVLNWNPAKRSSHTES
jgi:hypothetical protein